MVTKYGMSDLLGPVVYGTGHDEVFLGKEFSSSRDYSDKVAADIDAEIKSIVEKAYKKAEEILLANRDKLDFTAEYLITHEIMDEEQFALVMESDNPTVEALEEIERNKNEKSDTENKEISESSKNESVDNENADGQEKFTVRKKDTSDNQEN